MDDPIYLIDEAIENCVGKGMPGVANSVMAALEKANFVIEQDWRLIDDDAKTGAEVLAWFEGLNTPMLSTWCDRRQKFLMGCHKQPTHYKPFKPISPPGDSG